MAITDMTSWFWKYLSVHHWFLVLMPPSTHDVLCYITLYAANDSCCPAESITNKTTCKTTLLEQPCSVLFQVCVIPETDYRPYVEDRFSAPCGWSLTHVPAGSPGDRVSVGTCLLRAASVLSQAPVALMCEEWSIWKQWSEKPTGHLSKDDTLSTTLFAPW